MPHEMIIFLAAAIAMVIILKEFFAWQQSSVAEKQVREFKFYSEQKIPVQYTFTSYSSMSLTVGFPVKADMYIGDQFIFLVPGKYQFWNGIINFLPVVFAKDENHVKALTSVDNIFVPDTFALFGKQSIRIKYFRDFPYKLRIEVIVKVLDKEKIQELDKVKKWTGVLLKTENN